ncbi:MAG TPA: phospholipid carrier-dependent glycosyltransferase [Acidimicrobiia bacterium]
MRERARPNDATTDATTTQVREHSNWRERWFGAARRERLRLGARRHWLFLVVLGAGLVLRVVTQIAYRPALLYIDSYQYLGNLHLLAPAKNSQPIGYLVLLLRPVLAVANLAVVAGVQHLLGLGMGIAIYALVVRLGVRRWIAVLAAAPVLLDAYQLQIEQNIMSEALFQALTLAAIVLLLWRRPPTHRVLAVAGVLLGLATTVRSVGVVLVVPAVLFALVAGTGGWQRLIRAATIGLAFMLVIATYGAYYWIKVGDARLSRGDAYLIYGRAATIVDCRGLDLPDYERVLCPREPLGHRLGSDLYAHHSPYPLQVVVPPGRSLDWVLRDFGRRVVLHQPLDYTKAVATDFVKVFVFPRKTFPGDVVLERWQFQTVYPSHGHDPAAATRTYGGGTPRVVEPLAVFLRGYQLSVGYLPGPVYGLAFIAAFLAAAGVGRGRRSGLRAACLLTALSAVSVLLAADLFHFSWRYQLPALTLAPLAGALGLAALTGRVTPTSPSSSPAGAPPDAPGSPPVAS